MAVVTKRTCDMCGTEILESEKAGHFTIHPPIPEQLRGFKEAPHKLMDLALRDINKAKELAIIAEQAMNETQKFEMCGGCADFTLGTVQQMKNLQSLVNAGAKAN